MGAWSGTGRSLAVATLLSALAVGAGVLLVGPDRPAARPLATRLASLDTTVMAVRRAPFCAAVAPADAEAALGAPRATLDAWGNGDTVELGASSDVAHEFGCRWSAGDAGVSAWVFAPPVTVPRAQQLVAALVGEQGCTPVPGAAAYGSVSVAVRCVRSADGGRVDVRYAGLFGDAWLVCTTEGAPEATADRWCATVLKAASAAPATR